MSRTSTSPKKVAAAAYRVAREPLPEQRHRYGPKVKPMSRERSH
jgi:hypothetical protein